MYNEIYKTLEKYGQLHLLKYYDELSDESRENLLRQIKDIDFSLLSLLKNSNEKSKKGKIERIGSKRDGMWVVVK